MKSPSARRASTVLAAVLAAFPALADEGMFTFDNPPTKQLKEKYGFEPTKDWLDQVRLASVRFMDGGSGSFVSPDGLVITNHHVGLGCIQNLSSAENDYVKNGFYEPAREKEPACPGYEVNVLTGIEDVTAKVHGAVKPAMSDKDAREARKAAITKIENDCNASSGLRCDVVTLYQGGEYHLYRYKKYTDVRLVFAPGAGDRLLRRRPRQLHLPAPRPRHLPLPRLRERPAGEAGLLPAVLGDGRRRRRPRVRLRPPRLHLPARHGGPAEDGRATRSCPCSSSS